MSVQFQYKFLRPSMLEDMQTKIKFPLNIKSNINGCWMALRQQVLSKLRQTSYNCSTLLRPSFHSSWALTINYQLKFYSTTIVLFCNTIHFELANAKGSVCRLVIHIFLREIQKVRLFRWTFSPTNMLANGFQLLHFWNWACWISWK